MPANETAESYWAPFGGIIQALNVKDLGNKNSNRVLVFAHGFGTDKSVWSRIPEIFSSDNWVITYDLPCAGTVNPDFFCFRRYRNLHPYVQDLFLIIDTLRIKECVFVGHSISAMIGMLAAIERPILFSKLILIGASPCFKNIDDYHGGFEEDVVDELFKNMERNYSAWVWGYAPLAVGGDCSDEVIQEFSRTLFNMSPNISLFVVQQVFDSDLRDFLPMVKVPCYIIQSGKDPSVPELAATYLRDKLGGPKILRILPIEGHLPHLSAPAVVIREIRLALAWKCYEASTSRTS